MDILTSFADVLATVDVLALVAVGVFMLHQSPGRIRRPTKNPAD